MPNWNGANQAETGTNQHGAGWVWLPLHINLAQKTARTNLNQHLCVRSSNLLSHFTWLVMLKYRYEGYCFWVKTASIPPAAFWSLADRDLMSVSSHAVTREWPNEAQPVIKLSFPALKGEAKELGQSVMCFGRKVLFAWDGRHDQSSTQQSHYFLLFEWLLSSCFRERFFINETINLYKSEAYVCSWNQWAWGWCHK